MLTTIQYSLHAPGAQFEAKEDEPFYACARLYIPV